MSPKLTLLCGLVFVLGSLAGAFVSVGCGGDSTSADCPCPPGPAAPDPQTLPLSRLTTHDPTNSAAFLIETPSGSIAVTSTNVVIAYKQSGVDHRITYRIVGPATPSD